MMGFTASFSATDPLNSTRTEKQNHAISVFVVKLNSVRCSGS